MTKVDRIQSRVPYGSHGDRQHQKDKMVCDINVFYTFASSRGLSRGDKNPSSGELSHSHINTELKSLEGVTLLIHRQKLYLRHKGAPDVPFVRVDTGSLTLIEEEAKISPPAGEKARFKWTTAEDEPILNKSGHRRWMDIAPMCSDGRNIYVLVNYR